MCVYYIAICCMALFCIYHIANYLMNLSSPLEPERRAGLWLSLLLSLLVVLLLLLSLLLLSLLLLLLLWLCAWACSDCSQIGALGTLQTVPRSDSAYSVDGTADDREHALASGNGDLWQRYWHAVDLHLGCVLVVKVKAYAELEALSMGHTKWATTSPTGNHFADGQPLRRRATTSPTSQATTSPTGWLVGGRSTLPFPKPPSPPRWLWRPSPGRFSPGWPASWRTLLPISNPGAQSWRAGGQRQGSGWGQEHKGVGQATSPVSGAGPPGHCPQTP